MLSCFAVQRGSGRKEVAGGRPAVVGRVSEVSGGEMRGGGMGRGGGRVGGGALLDPPRVVYNHLFELHST